MSAAEPDHARLMQLIADLRRIATFLLHWSSEATLESPRHGSGARSTELSAQLLNSIIRARQLRSSYFASELFAEPAWDMMLELLAAEIAQRRVTVSSLCNSTEVPSTTALRWLKVIVDKGIAKRRPDRFDARRVYVELCTEASAALRRYFAEVAQT